MKKLFLFSCLALLVQNSIAQAEHRHALVIGNSNYPQAKLASPANDIRSVGGALQKRGFVVTQAEDLNAEQLRAAVDAFARRLPTRGTALIYFSGYALPDGKADSPQADNSLLPIDGNPHHAGSVFGSQTGATRLLGRLVAESGSTLNLLIVDGCYDHPGQAPNTPRGLVKTAKVPAESRIIFAAPPGEVLIPVAEGLSPLAKKLSGELNSSKALHDVLAQLSEVSAAEDAQLENLAAPASQAIAPPTELRPGAKPGDEWVNELGMIFCWTPPGKVTLGSTFQDPEHQADELASEVEFTSGFWMGKYEFTRREHFALKKTFGVYLSTGDHKLHPLNKFRADAPTNYLALLNEKAPAGWEYALPTEAEWEYAARAGTTTAYSFGNDPSELARYGNFADRSLRDSDAFGEIAKNWQPDAKPFAGDRQTGLFSYAHKIWSDGHATMARVGCYPPNPWGLCDTHGNLSELTATPYHEDRTPPAMFDDRVGWVSKGGSWLSTAPYCRAAFRGQFTFRSRENNTENYLGLRFVLRKQEGM